MATHGVPAPHRWRAGRRRRPAPTTSSTRPPRPSWARPPRRRVAQVEAAAAAAAEAFPAWSRTKPEERAALLNKAADLLRDRMDELIPLVQAETGATQRVASTMQVPTCIERFRRYAKGALEPTHDPAAAERDARHRAGRRAGSWARWSCGSPSAWWPASRPYNFPIVNMAGKIGPALAMGNTVVVKPAPQDPLAVTVFGEILHEAGFPAGRRQRRHRLGARDRPGPRRVAARRHGELHRLHPRRAGPSARWPAAT